MPYLSNNHQSPCHPVWIRFYFSLLYRNQYILNKNKKYPLILFIKIPANAFQYIRKLTILVICETSEDIMQEKLPPTVFRYESYHSKTSFSKSDNKLVLRMRYS